MNDVSVSFIWYELMSVYAGVKKLFDLFAKRFLGSICDLFGLESVIFVFALAVICFVVVPIGNV